MTKLESIEIKNIRPLTDVKISFAAYDMVEKKDEHIGMAAFEKKDTIFITSINDYMCNSAVECIIQSMALFCRPYGKMQPNWFDDRVSEESYIRLVFDVENDMISYCNNQVKRITVEYKWTEESVAKGCIDDDIVYFDDMLIDNWNDDERYIFHKVRWFIIDKVVESADRCMEVMGGLPGNILTAFDINGFDEITANTGRLIPWMSVLGSNAKGHLFLGKRMFEGLHPLLMNHFIDVMLNMHEHDRDGDDGRQVIFSCIQTYFMKEVDAHSHRCRVYIIDTDGTSRMYYKKYYKDSEYRDSETQLIDMIENNEFGKEKEMIR